MKLMQTVWGRAGRYVSPSLVILLLAGCTSATYNDPVNPKNPYMFPGQAPTSSAITSTQATSAPEVAPAPGVPVTTPSPAPAIPVTPASPPATPAAVPANPIDAETAFRAGDSMIVSFSDLPPPGLLPINIELGPDGKITLHHNVQIYALGKTPRMLEQEIRSEYVPKFYKYLTVTIKTELRTFHVNGEVRQPAMYPWRGETTVLRAIGQAGGFTDWSRKKKVQLTRASGRKFIVNCEKAQWDPVLDLPVYPGDYINVPKKNWLGY